METKTDNRAAAAAATTAGSGLKPSLPLRWDII
jgi:hypothetical protein